MNNSNVNIHPRCVHPEWKKKPTKTVAGMLSSANPVSKVYWWQQSLCKRISSRVANFFYMSDHQMIRLINPFGLLN